MKKKFTNFFFILLFLIIFIFIYIKFFKQNKVAETETNLTEDASYSSNILKDVNYTSRDAKGNEYIINAKQGEIDYSNTDIIYLTKVNSLIKLNDSNTIKITSDFGRYNTNNFNTIFSKNVIIRYLDNKITGEYLDFSTKRNSMIISKNIIYTNLENILKADVAEIDIETKDTKIFMYNNRAKVNIKSKD